MSNSKKNIAQPAPSSASNPELDLDSAYNQARRDWLVRALSVGAIGASALSLSGPSLAQLFGTRQPRVAAGRSFSRLEGEVYVNGLPADINTVIQPGNSVETGAGASASFVVDSDAYQLRENTRIRILRQVEPSATSQFIQEGIELAKGAALFVFGRRTRSRMRVTTAFATIGLRGTGLYMEAEENRSYFCLCYGETDLSANAAPDQVELVESTHHDSPRYIYGADAETLITEAPLKDHTDLELAILEDMVGREVPFPLDEYYDTPRREDY